MQPDSALVARRNVVLSTTGAVMAAVATWKTPRHQVLYAALSLRILETRCSRKNAGGCETALTNNTTLDQRKSQNGVTPHQQLLLATRATWREVKVMQ